ncbi:putative thiosesterase family protein [Desulforapulum autotrophicum HRM2]|uniref:Thiosesterase family protein n=1 Tax=Desulforapulum autotrophicum (strain ATCC 43914 / DSM 3382 / VKM B-1955 / HRM2) TaxID=177437 RepID=C0QH43_DESAH|nr:thioesterase family protein [Desulforapulum autotrophicum]ACN15692.1 putative thiosesterase family protein [Desulforapulum autotrophicum HRM2]
MPLENTPFTQSIDIRFADTDANGHVFFANYLTYFDTAFLKYLDHISCSFDWFIQNNMNFYYVEACSQYKSALTYGDEILVSVTISKFGRTSFTIAFEGKHATSGRLAATGHIVAVVVDKATEAPVEIPEAFKIATRIAHQS